MMTTTTATNSPSMNEANEQRPVQQQLLRHAGRSRLQAGQPAGARRQRLQRADHPRLRGRLRREGPARRPVRRPARSIPAGTATLRDFSNIAPEIPEYIPENCTGCMDCVTECPDTAILGKVLAETELEAEARRRSPKPTARCSRRSGRRPRSTTTAGKKKGGAGGMFNIIIDPSASARAAPSASPSATTTP